MTRTQGEENGIILTEEESHNLHLWLEDYLSSLIFYEEKETTEKHRLALEIRKKSVWEFCDNLLKELCK